MSDANYETVDITADITIIGAGVIGLAVAAQVSKQGREVYVLEKNETFGQETSSRHSEVIHSGIYYPQGSLKARMCVKGRAMLYELCEKHNIGHKKLEKLIVSTNKAENKELQVLLECGNRNGVTDLEIITKEEINKIEPNVRAEAALYSPSTGIIDSHGLMQYFSGTVKDKGGQIFYKSKVVGIERMSQGYKVTVEDSTGTFVFMTRILINCAGLESDQIAQLAGIDVDKSGYRLHYCKGEYFSVADRKRSLANRLIYPTPSTNVSDLGIHVTLDLGGRMRLGPNARYVSEIDYHVDSSQKRAFYESVVKFLPFIEYDDLEPEMAGVRPKLQGPGEAFRDFVITDERKKDLPGLINLIGIESPGLTSAPAIAEYVESLVDELL